MYVWADYTYPPIENVSLDTKHKLTVKEREAQRSILQKYFGFDPVKFRNRFETVSLPLFSHDAKHALLPGHEPVLNYRHFVILTSLSATAFSGSYSLAVSLSTANGQVPIGSVSVLGRGKSSSCGNCQRRQAAGARVRGVIVVPHEVIVGFLGEHSFNNTDAGNKDFIEGFKNQIQASIVLPSGKVRAKTSGSPPESEGQTLPSHTIPLLELQSANVSALRDETYSHNPSVPQEESPRTPYDFYDWRNHDSLVTGHWVAKGGEN